MTQWASFVNNNLNVAIKNVAYVNQVLSSSKIQRKLKILQSEATWICC